jgi:hypothetical protein
VFSRKPSSGRVLYGRDTMEVVRKEERHMCRHVSTRSDMFVVVYDGNRCIAKYPKRTHVKLRNKAFLRREKCSGQYKGNLYCPASELAFLAM